MSFEIYIHGVPNGHDIVGPETNREYISRFYNASDSSEDAVMQIDIYKGSCFYTYLRKNNVANFSNRPGSFFALTVCFNQAYCQSVYLLFRLLEAVYTQICEGTIIRSDKKGSQFLVGNLNDARFGGQSAVELIRTKLAEKLTEIPVRAQQTGVVDTYNRAKKTISLMDVDSPTFLQYCGSYSLTVSPTLPASSAAYDDALNFLSKYKDKSSALESENAKLKEEVATLSQKDIAHEEERRRYVSESEKKRKQEQKEHNARVEKLQKERDELQRRMTGAKESVTQLQRNFNLFAETFTNRKDGSEDFGASPSKNGGFGNWTNSILLMLILFVCIATLFFG